MNKTINLSKILHEYMKKNKWYLSDRLKEDILSAIREACMQTIDLCAEEAEADVTFLCRDDYRPPEGEFEVYVLKNSILKVKEQIV